MEGGNNLEQATALVAAANRVVQDPSSVGSALRTISLRLRGTSVEVLEEMGEETDGVVESVSKMQEKIKALTGVDIVDMNGAYKDTYTILREIGNVWEEMSDMDKAAALELMAGKNRANTLSAILSNMEDLEGAYETASNAEGSALKENEAYLDSIQGRIDMFTNSLQTMWMNALDSDMIKGFVDLGRVLIEIIDKLGVFKTALAGVFAYLGTSKNNTFDLASMLGIHDIKAGWFSKQKNSAFNIDLDSAGIGKQIDLLNTYYQSGQENFANYISSLGQTGDVSNNAAAALKAYAASVDNGSYSLVGFNKFVEHHNTAVQASGIKAKVAAVGHQLLNAALSMGISLLASFAIEALVKGLDELIKTNDELIEQAEELKNTYQSETEAIENNLSTLKNLEDEFNTLSQGVDNYGKNISLATNDYARYQEIVQEILGMSPSLVEGYDDEGNAIANKNGLIQKSIELMQEEQRLKAQDLTSDENLKTLGAGIQAEIDQYKTENPLPYGDAKSNFTKEFEKSLQEYVKSADGNYEKTIYDALNPDNRDLDDFWTEGYWSEYGENSQNFAIDYYDQIVEDLRNQDGVLRQYLTQDQVNNLLEYANTYEENVQNYNNKLGAINKKFNATLQMVPIGETAYYNLSGEMQGFLSQYIDGLDVTVENLEEKKDDIVELTNFLANNTDAQSMISVGFKLNIGKDKDGNGLSVSEYQKQVSDFKKEIEKSAFTDKQKNMLLSVFGLDDDESMENEIDAAIQHVTNILKGKADKLSAEAQAYLNGLSVDEVLYIKANISTDLNGLSVDELKEKIKQSYSFDFMDYTESISGITESISAYQEALEKLDSGSFTMSDYIELIKEFPDLAKGVDVSSKSFKGLSTNLRNAIKSSPKSLIKDLKDLRAKLVDAGKSTVEIDQLITAIENMPEEAVKSMTDEYSTLTDQINAAKKAQTELQEAMNKNPNEGFETRGEAMEYMKDKMGRGEIGSESELWDVAAEYGFTYDSAKSIQENADALAEFIAVREKWFKQDDDGNYTFEGTESFVEAVESAVANSPELQKILTWSYDEDTGVFDFDFDNENWEEIIRLLSESEQLAGLTSDEFADMMVQIGQYFGIEWGNNQDILNHLDKIAGGASDAKTKVEEYGKAMQTYFGSDTKVDLTTRPTVSGETMRNAGWDEFDGDYATMYSSGYSNADGTVTISVTPILPDGEVLSPEALEYWSKQIVDGTDPAEIKFTWKEKEYTGEDIFLKRFEGENSQQLEGDYGSALSKAQAEYDRLRTELDPLNIEMTLDKEGLEGLKEIPEIQDSIITKADGAVVIDEESFRESAVAAGYTEQKIDELLATMQEYDGLIRTTPEDPLGLKGTTQSINVVSEQLDTLGIQYTVFKDNLGNPVSLEISAPSLITTLANQGWTVSDIEAYLQLIGSGTDGLNLTIKGDAGKSVIQAAVDKANEMPETKDIDLNIDQTDLTSVETRLSNLDGKTVDTYLKIHETLYKNTSPDSGANTGGTVGVNGNFHPSGSAFANGTIGAPKTETALLGELGPEMLVRNGRWTTVGENGAEFTQVKKGDIIFNHKQTKDLLSKGYVTGRGKAYASGTAYASGGGTYSRYDFSGNGGYTKYDVNDKVVDKFGNAADSLSGAADDISDAADEFEEVFDWIEVRLEEITTQLDYQAARLENTNGIENRHDIINEMIEGQRVLYENLMAGAQRYYTEADKYLAQIPEEYREMAKNGAISIEEFEGKVDEETLELIKKYREWGQKGDDARKRAEEALTEIRRLADEAFNTIVDHYEDERSFNQGAIDQNEAYQDYIETTMGGPSEAAYQEMIRQRNEEIGLMEQQRAEMQEELDRQVAEGIIEVGSPEWYERINAIADLDTEIIKARTEVANWQDDINQIRWDNFDNLMDRISAISDEAENLISILSEKDLFTDDGEWTDEGITTLGLYAQQMEAAEYAAKKYQEEIDYLNENWQALGMTEEEYQERLKMLKDGQYEAIKAYQDSKKAIVEENKARVEAIKDGIDKEIEAYAELIDKKKEELDAEKDLYDFQKNMQKSAKDIADLERQLAALAGDNSASARAKRAQLEAELAEAKADMQDQYYQRGIDDQKDALDKEQENFEKEKEAEKEALDKWLEDTNAVVAESIALVQDNASTVYTTLIEMGEEYGLSIAESITAPWTAGKSAIQDFSDTFGLSMSKTVEELEEVEKQFNEVIDSIEQRGKEAIERVIQNYQEYTRITGPTDPPDPDPDPPTPPTPPTPPAPTKPSLKKGSYIEVKPGTKWYADSYGGGASGKAKSGKIKYINKSGSHPYNIDGLGWIRKKDIKGYAKGSTGIRKNQLAWVDELGDELQLVPGKNGRLEYLKKGTAVIPSKISENLMELGKLDPSEVLSRNRPQIAPLKSITNNTSEFKIDASVGTLLHVERLDGNNPDEIVKLVNRAWDKKMQTLNNAIKSKTR